MKLHKRRRRQHWFQFAMAASSWFFVEITANFKSESPYSAGLKMSLFERLALYGLRPIMLNTQCLGAGHVYISHIGRYVNVYIYNIYYINHIHIYIHSYIHILDIYIYIHSLYMAVCIQYVRADNCDNQVLLQELITLIT